MKRYEILIQSESHSRAVETRLIELGYSWGEMVRDPFSIGISQFVGEFIILSPSEAGTLSWSHESHFTRIDLESLYCDVSKFKPTSPEVTVKMAGEDVATMTELGFRLDHPKSALDFKTVERLYIASVKEGKL